MTLFKENLPVKVFSVVKWKENCYVDVIIKEKND